MNFYVEIKVTVMSVN